MTEKRKNPIAEQSRQWLIASLFNLMNKKQYSEITVSEISENALLSRRTFYRIFNSKEEILQEYFLSICDEYLACFETGHHYTLGQIVEIFFSFWEQHFELLVLFQKNHLFFYLLEVFNKVLPTMHNIVQGNQLENENPMELKLGLLASAGALWNILAEWLQLNERPSPQQMSKLVLSAIKTNL